MTVTPGVLLVVSGPSGVGKSTLVRAAMEVFPDLGFSVSATTRSPREGEADGVDYHFLTDEEFAEKLEQDAFLEHATVYGRSYGTLLAATVEALRGGRSLILDIDVQGARQVRDKLPDAVTVLVAPPSIAALEARLRSRGTDSDEIIAKRMGEVREQLGAFDLYDYLVVNDELDTAHAEFQSILRAELCRTQRRARVVDHIRDELEHA